MIIKALKKVKRQAKSALRPKILKGIKTVSKRSPRLSGLEKSDEVFAYKGSNSEILSRIESEKDTLFDGFAPKDKVLIKINLNTANPYPASSDPLFLEKIVDVLISMGIRDIYVGDCTSNMTLPTKKIFNKTGIANMLKGRAQIVCFDQGNWVDVAVNGEYFKNIVVPEKIYEFDRIIYICNTKSHELAEFSMSLKHAVGFMHPYQRFDLHASFLLQKAVEINLAVRPDLVFLDARKMFITGGPNFGDVAMGESVFAGRDLFSIDLEGYKLLYKFKKENDCLGSFKKDPLKMKQFEHAAKILK